MSKICFVCLGNICRSPMAEFIMKDILNKKGILQKHLVVSRATSYEEQGNDIYPQAKEKLTEKNISYTKRAATRLEPSDYEKYDYFLCMEESNIKNAKRILGEDKDNKIRLLIKNKDITDPWYTRNFESTYNDLVLGINNFIKELESE